MMMLKRLPAALLLSGMALVPLLSAPALAADTVAADKSLLLQVAGLHKPAEILIDTWGVPHMYAASQDDVFFVAGFQCGA